MPLGDDSDESSISGTSSSSGGREVEPPAWRWPSSEEEGGAGLPRWASRRARSEPGKGKLDPAGVSRLVWEGSPVWCSVTELRVSLFKFQEPGYEPRSREECKETSTEYFYSSVWKEGKEETIRRGNRMTCLKKRANVGDRDGKEGVEVALHKFQTEKVHNIQGGGES